MRKEYWNCIHMLCINIQLHLINFVPRWAFCAFLSIAVGDACACHAYSEAA